jgi:hypothetical protein
MIIDYQAYVINLGSKQQHPVYLQLINIEDAYYST